MKKLLVVIAIVALVLIAFSVFNRKKRPNIIIINVDDLGWRDLGFMGSKFYESPNIDHLSNQGIVFSNGYAAAANSAPSRASLLTGQWTPRHGIYTVGSSSRGKSKDRKLIPVENTQTLADKHDVFPEILKESGYSTCHAGKWHMSDNPLDYGFDVNIGGGHNGHPTSYFAPFGNVNLDAEEGAYLTDVIMDQVLDFVKSTKEPFLLYYSPYAVHTPIQAVDSLKSKYENKPSWNAQGNAAYASMIENLDRNIGLLIAALEKLNELDNTFIVFTSDNGGLYGITSQQPLRAGKGSYYEGGIRVPFSFFWKGKIKPGSQSDYTITNMDLFPTILDVAAIDKEGYAFDGLSILPVLKGTDELEVRPLFWHFPVYLQSYKKNNLQNRDPLFRTRPGSVVRYDDWKLHYYYESDEIELFNLKLDIGETMNLVNKYPQKAEELVSLLLDWKNKVQAPVPHQLNPDWFQDEN